MTEIYQNAKRFRLALALGGARSGKSAFAERFCAEAADAEIVCLVTAQALDDEMRDRIARHRLARDPAWRTVEAPRALAAALRQEDAPGRVLLVDCLTLWLSNAMLAGADCDGETAELLDALAALRARTVLVSNEVGLGVAPATPLGRAFRDAAGRLNQRVAATADLVVFLAAGLPLALKAP